MNKEEVKIDCSRCPAFGIYCPHIVNGDPYYYNCTMTVAVLEKENAELKSEKGCQSCVKFTEVQLTKAKEILKLGLEGIKREFIIDSGGNKPFAKEALKMCNDYCEQAEQFLKDSEVEK